MNRTISERNHRRLHGSTERASRRLFLALCLLAAGILATGFSDVLAADLPAGPAPIATAGAADSPIRLDGVLDEASWSRAGVITDLTQQDPHPGEPTFYRTEIRLLVDRENLYVGVRCLDPEPGKIAVHTMQRDGDMSGDDAISFVIDTFEDARTGYFFRVNAAGARQDGLISGPEEASLDWDGIWDARVRRSSEGWTAEIVIPARTLRFPAGNAGWGFNIQRYVARERLRMRWTGTTLDASLTDLRRAGRLAGIGDLRQGPGVSVSPYALGRREARFHPSSAGGGGDAGLDVTWSITPGLSAVGTLNTDFAETEADTRQINLTRFDLFFPEKRSFFLEGANQFDFGNGLGLEQDFIPFFSRRVGLVGNDQVPIDAGVKLVGRHGPVGVGLLDVATGDSPAAPPTNLFAGMATLDATEHLRFGAIATVGDPNGYNDNRLGGVNAVWRTATFKGDKNFVAGIWSARSWDDAPREPGALSFHQPGIGPTAARDAGRSGSGWGFNVEYPNDLWDAFVTYKDFGDALHPAIGFLPRPGTRWYQIGQAYQPRPQDGWWASKIRQFYFETFVTYVEDLNGRAESWRVFTAPFNVQTQGGDHLEANWAPQYERVDLPFEISPGVVIPPGDYHFTRYRVEAQSSEFRPLRVGATCWLGEFFDGSLTQILAFASFTTFAGRLEMALDTEDDFGSLPEGEFVQRVIRLKAVYAFTPNLVLSAFTQYDSETGDLGANSRLRWTIRPGTDFYIVWNRGWQRPLPDPGDLTLAPSSDEIVVKLRHAWRP